MEDGPVESHREDIAGRAAPYVPEVGVRAAGHGSPLGTIKVLDPGVNLLEGNRPPTSLSEQPFTRMAEDLLRLARDMEEAGSLGEHSEIKVDVDGYRDYRGVPVFGAWMWEPHLGCWRAEQYPAWKSCRRSDRSR